MSCHIIAKMSANKTRNSEHLQSWRSGLKSMPQKWAAALSNNIPGIEHDVKFLAGEDRKIICGHKLVLAVCSSVFQAIFSIQSKTETGGEAMTIIEVPDVDFNVMTNIFKQSENVYVVICEYAYTGEMDVNLEYALKTMNTAHKYDIPEMVEHCSGLLKRKFSVDRAINVYQSAVVLDDKELMTKAEKYIVRNFHKILDSDGFLCLTKDQLCKFLKSDAINAPSETGVFKSIIRWGKHQCELQGQEKTKEYLREILEEPLHYIHMSSISASYFVSVIRPSGLFSSEEKVKLFRYFWFRKEKKDTQPLLKELNLPVSVRRCKISDGIAILFSDFIARQEILAGDFCGEYSFTRFHIDGDETDPPVYLKAVGFAGRPSQCCDIVTMYIKVNEYKKICVSKPKLFPKLDTYTYSTVPNKITMVDLKAPVRIVPNIEYTLYALPIKGAVARWWNRISDIVIYNKINNVAIPINLKVNNSFDHVYSMKFSFSE